MKLLLIILLTVIYTISAQQLYEHQIIPFDGLGNDHFGRSVAASDSFLFISSLRYSNLTENAVYVYKLENNNYNFQNKLFPSDTQTGIAGQLFGSSMLLKDNQLFIGAQNKIVNGLRSGTVYLFEYENYKWVEKQKIVPPWGQHGGAFSISISKWGSYLLVGAIRYGTIVPQTGMAFLYEFINGNYELYQEFIPFDGEEGQNFGGSVIIKDSLILISSISDSTESGFFSGSIYVFYKDDTLWSFKKKYIPEPNSDYLGFGSAIAITEDFIFIGASGIAQGFNPGEVYLYKYSGPGLNFAQKINTGDNYFYDDFGIEILAENDTLLVGETFDSIKNENPGSVYLFVNEKGEWKRKNKIFPSDESEAHSFGSAIVINQDKIIIGAHESRINNIFTGKVYIFTAYPLSVFDNDLTYTEGFFLSQNYPNPFNLTTNIYFHISRRGRVILKIYDIIGRGIKTW